jgi:2-aminoadipate transaminase
MISALAMHCSPFMNWNKPRGGFFIWCKLKSGLNSSMLFKELLYNEVAVISGGAFFSRPEEGEEWLRLSYSYESESQIEKGIRIIGGVSEKILAKRNKSRQKE